MTVDLINSVTQHRNVDLINSQGTRAVTRRIRIRTKYRKPLDDDQLALAFLMLAKQLRTEANPPAKVDEKRRAK